MQSPNSITQINDFTTVPPTCSPVRCKMFCQHGFKRNSAGCEFCECRSPPAIQCPSIRCRMHCEHGFKTDANGCDTCECKQNPTCGENIVSCQKNCEFGFEVDDNNCPHCECRKYPLECGEKIASCQLRCDYGFAVDENKCPICQCKGYNVIVIDNIMDDPRPTVSGTTTISAHINGFMVVLAMLVNAAIRVMQY
ncbi:unnamed protein product [Owenia fusiformis]|uniref:Uncharacterized protein n=1 Tax=Owenia fusiformis TaxID=6347 RepID=A0A8J1XZE1_OWEFU|nr:unnamed protein product [Owenia fusiformis]